MINKDAVGKYVFVIGLIGFMLLSLLIFKIS